MANPRLARLATHPYLLLTLVMLFWGGNAVVGRAAVGEVPPIALAFWRWFGAGLVLLPFAWRHLKADWPVLRRGWRMMLVLGIGGVGINNTLQYLALQWTTAINAGLVNATLPVFVMLTAVAVLGERPRKVVVAGMLLSLAGVVAIIGRGDPAVLLALDFNRGDLIMLVGMVVWAIYTVLLRWQPKPVHPLGFLTASVLIGTLSILPLYLAELASGRHINPSPASVFCIGYAAVFPSTLAYLFYLRGVRELGPTAAGHFNYLIPVFSSTLAMLFLGERLHWFHAAGAAAIFLGIWIATRQARPASA